MSARIATKGRRAAVRRRSTASARLRVLLGLAARNVRRHVRRSTLTAAAMILGLALLIFFRALADGMHEAWIEQGVRLGSGHIALRGRGWGESGSLADRLRPREVSAARAAFDSLGLERRVRAVAPRLSVSGLASSAGSAVPVQIVAVDPSLESAFSPLSKAVSAGRFLRPEDRLGAFLGTALARRLGVEPGSRVVLSAQDASGQIAGQLVRVVGVFRSGVPELDEGVVQIPIGTARDWLGAPGSATTLAVLLHSADDLPDVLPRLQRALAGMPGVEVLSWREASPELDSAVRVDDYGDYVFHAILLAIVALAIMNAILMSVLNRTRELGVLEALGLTPAETGFVVFAEGMLLTLLSGAAGIVTGLAVTWGLFRNGLDLSALFSGDIALSGVLFDPHVVPDFRLSTVLWSLATVVLIGLAASLYPARQAARIDVAEAVKSE